MPQAYEYGGPLSVKLVSIIMDYISSIPVYNYIRYFSFRELIRLYIFLKLQFTECALPSKINQSCLWNAITRKRVGCSGVAL